MNPVFYKPFYTTTLNWSATKEYVLLARILIFEDTLLDASSEKFAGSSKKRLMTGRFCFFNRTGLY